MLKRIAAEPLVHFSLLALLIFAAYALLAPKGAQPDDTAIVVSAPKIGQIAAIFERTWQRPPTPDELKAMIDDYIDEEILVREAQALGLEEDDTVIRRRLRQKMEFLGEAEVTALAPSDADLQAFLDTHPEMFAVEPRIGFEQVFLNPERRGAAIFPDAEALMATLKADPAVDPATTGDASLLPPVTEPMSITAIGRIFGPDFAAAVEQAAPGVWTGPIESAYGVHLIRVRQGEAGRLPPLDEVREVVLREWTNARSKELAADRMAALRERYQITIEVPAAPGTAP